MNFTKRFDKVPRQLLMKKLSKVPNIDSRIFMWIYDFLWDRKQCVVIDQNQSPEIAVTSRVLQGSVLGPTIFLVYINTKCSIMSFNQTSAAPAAAYTLNTTPLNTVQQSKYLGVILQSDLKFSSHIQLKVSKAKQQLGMIKQVLHGAPQMPNF